MIGSRAPHVVPEDATEESHFRCEWGPWPTCDLSYQACQLRQTARRRPAGKGGRRRSLPIYEHCATTCHVGKLVTARFGRKTERFSAINAHGRLQVHRPSPAVQEEAMATPKGGPERLCQACGKERLRVDNRSGVCNRCRKGRGGLNPDQMTVGELVRLAQAVAAELDARLERVRKVRDLELGELERARLALRGGAQPIREEPAA